MKKWINKGYETHIQAISEMTAESVLIKYQTLILYNNKIIEAKQTKDYPEDYIIESVIQEHWREQKLNELGI